nr:MAG TPA: hypothetical protein [Caudoviricetes sp.]
MILIKLNHKGCLRIHLRTYFNTSFVVVYAR